MKCRSIHFVAHIIEMCCICSLIYIILRIQMVLSFVLEYNCMQQFTPMHVCMSFYTKASRIDTEIFSKNIKKNHTVRYIKDSRPGSARDFSL